VIVISLYGRLGKDPQLRSTTAGKPMAFASMVCSVARGEAEDDEWFQIAAFGATADLLAKHQKGDMVAVTGQLTRSRWNGPNGEERASWSVRADSLVSARTVRPGGGRRRAAPKPAADFVDDDPGVIGGG